MPGKTLVAIADASGAIRLVNRHCEEALGRTLAELRGQPIWQRLPSEAYVDRMHQACLRVATGRRVDDEQGLWRTRSGRSLAVEWSYSPWNEAGGADTAHGVVITGSRVEAAPARRQVSARSLHRPIGTLAAVLARLPLVGAAGPADAVIHLIERILAPGALAKPGGYAALFAGSPGIDSAMARPAAALSGVPRRADLALRVQAEFGQYCRTVIDSASDAIVALSPDGKVQLWSQGAERMLGYSEDQVKHRTINFLVMPEELNRGLSLEEAAWRSNRPRCWRALKRHQDGSAVSVDIASSPIRDCAGRRSGAVWVMRTLDPPQRRAS
jgi:PAS domain S-box-containing protein